MKLFERTLKRALFTLGGLTALAVGAACASSPASPTLPTIQLQRPAVQSTSLPQKSMPSEPTPQQTPIITPRTASTLMPTFTPTKAPYDRQELRYPRVGDELTYQGHLDWYDVNQTHSRIYNGPLKYTFKFLGVETHDLSTLPEEMHYMPIPVRSKVNAVKFSVHMQLSDGDDSATMESYFLESPPFAITQIIQPLIEPDWTSQKDRFKNAVNKQAGSSLQVEDYYVRDDGNVITFYVRLHKRAFPSEDIIREFTWRYAMDTGILMSEKINLKGKYEHWSVRYILDLHLTQN